jgi:phytoene/squalene synthetase
MTIDSSALLARKITWRSSQQTYLIATLLTDRGRADDCLRAYAYLRWADDCVDDPARNAADRLAFIRRQLALLEELYRGGESEDLSPQESMLADLVSRNRGAHGGLRSFLTHFLSVIAFDARRFDQRVTRAELADYTKELALAVMDGIQFFIGNDHHYPYSADRTAAVEGAHITHMLRDLRGDLANGIINVPREWGMGAGGPDVTSDSFRLWVGGEVEAARARMAAGKRYINSLNVLRCRLAGLWYSARFESILDTIVHDGYRLRASYEESETAFFWLRMAGIGIRVAVSHGLRECMRWMRTFFQRAYAWRPSKTAARLPGQRSAG